MKNVPDGKQPGANEQFRSDAHGDLVLRLATIPYWAEAQEAVYTEGNWPPTNTPTM